MEMLYGVPLVSDWLGPRLSPALLMARMPLPSALVEYTYCPSWLYLMDWIADMPGRAIQPFWLRAPVLGSRTKADNVASDAPPPASTWAPSGLTATPYTCAPGLGL